MSTGGPPFYLMQVSHYPPFLPVPLHHSRPGVLLDGRGWRGDPLQVMFGRPPRPQPPAVNIPGFSSMALNESLMWHRPPSHCAAALIRLHNVPAARLLPDQIVLFRTITLLAHRKEKLSAL